MRDRFRTAGHPDRVSRGRREQTLEYRFARRVTAIEPSPTVAVSDRARRLQAEGQDIIDLGGGDPDFPTPAHIVAAAADAMEAGDTHYVASPGIPELRRAIAEKLRADNRLEYDPGEIVVTPGGKAAIYAAIMALVDEGDEVLILDPGWVSYAPEVTLAAGKPVSVPLSAEDDFAITAERLASYATPRTRALILCTPNNPTGRVATVGDRLNAIPGVYCPLPQGAFYAFPDIRGTGLSSTACAELLIERARVAVTPGNAFGDAGEGHIRLSFATSDALLTSAVQ